MKKWVVRDEYDTEWEFETKQEALNFYWERSNEDYHMEIIQPNGRNY